ncbi:MAG: divalent-cation tolerance protein CutA [Archangium sp.]|nr:divalent-cation tolerance protein CutA [Archangium sp.]MDP3152876.1 divalent-cation tolerance protein CutA [Archangium sp.]MDP3569035.1 divalent-cation tolerance protein CutA [Archangium sp.]
MSSGIAVVLVTAPNEENAALIARTLIEERLIMCANLLPGVRSLYRWEGAVADEREVMMVLKAPAAHYPALQARILSLHPSTVPEVLRLEVPEGSPAYLQWVLSA